MYSRSRGFALQLPTLLSSPSLAPSSSRPPSLSLALPRRAPQLFCDDMERTKGTARLHAATGRPKRKSHVSTSHPVTEIECKRVTPSERKRRVEAHKPVGIHEPQQVPPLDLHVEEDDEKEEDDVLEEDDGEEGSAEEDDGEEGSDEEGVEEEGSDDEDSEEEEGGEDSDEEEEGQEDDGEDTVMGEKDVEQPVQFKGGSYDLSLLRSFETHVAPASWEAYETGSEVRGPL